MSTAIDEPGEWFTLSEASRMLGVHPATVRQWSDEGKLGVFRTPGGHRRFARSDIDRLLQFSPVRGAGLASYLFDETLARTRQGLPEALVHADWARHLPDDDRHRWRLAGRQLVALATQLVQRERVAEEQARAALRCGGDYGRMMKKAGLSLPDAVIAYLFFRDSLVETVLQLPETTGLPRSATLAIVRRVNHLLNGVLRSMMQAYEAEGAIAASDEQVDSVVGV